MSKDKSGFSNIPWAAVGICLVFVWPAGLVMLFLKLFGDDVRRGISDIKTQIDEYGKGSGPKPRIEDTTRSQDAQRHSNYGSGATYYSSGASGSYKRGDYSWTEAPQQPKREVPKPRFEGERYQSFDEQNRARDRQRAVQAQQNAQMRAQQQEAAKAEKAARKAERKTQRLQARRAAQAAASAPENAIVRMGGPNAAVALGGVAVGGGAFALALMALGGILGSGIVMTTLTVAGGLISAVAVLGGASAMVAGGISRARRMRYRRLLKIIGSTKVVPIDRLAALTGMSVQSVARDIDEMINNNYINGAYIDYERGELVFGNPFERTSEEIAFDKAKREGTLTPAQEIRARNEQIADPDISAKLDRLEMLTNSIFDYVNERPDKLSKIRNFTGYYLPTTMKILDAYIRFERQHVDGENITGAMKDIVAILDELVKGYESQLDSLFMDDALDISAEVTVLENMLTKEGLRGSGFNVEK